MGSLFSKPKAPAAPDPAATAAAQSAANLETAIAQGWLNATNQYSPFGSVTYNQIGTQRVGDKDVPQFAQNINLSPAEQAKLNQTQGLELQALGLGKNVLGNVSGAISGPFSIDGLPALPTDFTADRDRVTQGIIDRNQPMLDRQRSSQETQLANQGIMRGSEAWSNAQDDLGRQENDFRLAALQAGGAEQSRLFGLTNSARQQGIQEQAFQRSQPINEYATLLGLGGNVQSPQFSGYQPGQLAGTDVVGPINMQYQGQLASYNAQNQARQSTQGSLFGLAGAGLSAYFSDIRLKYDISTVGAENGFPIYTFRYKGDPMAVQYRGVMAQDVMETRPDAIIPVGNYMGVDYGKLGIHFGKVH